MRVLTGLVVLVIAISACIAPDNLPMLLSQADRAEVYEAVEIHRQAIALFEKGNVRDAITLAAKAAELLESKLGPDHVHVAVPLRSLAVFHQSQGDYAEAERLFARVLAILERTGSGDGLGLVVPLDDLAGLYMQWAVYEKAARLYGRMLSIRLRVRGARDPSIIDSLNSLALALEMQGNHSSAESIYKRALALAERELGSRHVGVARGLEGLAMVYTAQGTYDRAEPLLVRSLQIRTDVVSEVRRFGPLNLNKIADLFPNTRSLRSPRFTDAMALDLVARTISAFNTHTMHSLSNLDQLQSVSAPNMQPLVARTADIYNAFLQSAQSDLAQTTEQLVALHVATGDYQRAEPLLRHALDEREKTMGRTHPDLANSLNDLAQLYQNQGAYAKAEPLLLRVLEIRRQALGERHPDVARSLNNLALLYVAQDESAKAEPLLAQAVDVFEHSLGNAPADLARCLNNLALLHHVQGDLGAAEPLYLRAIDIASKTPGDGYPDIVRYLTNLAVLYHANGQSSKAEPLLRRAVAVRESRLDTELARLTPPRKRALMALVQQETEALVSLHVESTPTSAAALDLALSAVLRRKGLALESLLEGRAALRGHLTPEMRQHIDQLAADDAALAALRRAPADSLEPSARASQIAAITARIDGLESDLGAASAQREARAPVTVARIQAALPRDAVLVEYVRYHRFDPRPDQPRWQGARYAAYVVTPAGAPRWVALGDAAAIDAGIDAVLAEMRRGGDPQAASAALRHLDELVLEPLRDALADVSHLIVAPDGALNLVPFDALRDPQGRYELEHRLVSYVTSGRDLLRRGPRQAPREPPTIVAAPDYGPGRFAPLASAGAEAAEVAGRFAGARLLLGPQATKAALIALRGPAVLHIATHGFFAREFALPATAAAPVALAGDARERGMDVEGVLAPVERAVDGDPDAALDRAGLALARANVSPEGIVTAREIANYDWWGTELVVLSACETGVGAAPSGAGMYGLRSALAQAGAESQVVSLWSVSETSVRALMREFYAELARGTGRAEALRRAKRRMLQQPAFAHPYDWAAFIPAGDWTPLDKNARLRGRSAR